MPQLSDAFGLSALGVASLVGLFYYGYSPFSLVAGVAMDRLGPRKVVPLGAAAVGVGALLFATGNSQAGERRPVAAGRRRRLRAGRRRLHRDHELPAVARGHADRRDADVRHGRRIGRPVRRRSADRRRRAVERVLDRDGRRRPRDRRRCSSCCSRRQAPGAAAATTGCKRAARALVVVFRNPQSILCGLIAGLLFIPTTIFDMIWGVRFLQEARGFDYGDGGDALGDGAARLDHRLPAARLHLGPDRPAQAGDRRRRAGPARVPRLDPVRRPPTCFRPTSSASSRASRRARRCCPTP